MRQPWTKEPWSCTQSYHPEQQQVACDPYIQDATGRLVAAALFGSFTTEEQYANARRIVSAVNGCAGLNPATYRELVAAGQAIAACLDDEGKFTGRVPSAAEFRRFQQALAQAQELGG